MKATNHPNTSPSSINYSRGQRIHVLLGYDDDHEGLLEARRVVATLGALRSYCEIAHSKMYSNDE